MIRIKVLVCSAWPYAHDIPHLGNLIGSLLSGDVFARYYRLRGFDTLYVSGSDMHGTSIEVEAIKQGIPPKELTEKNHKKIKKLIEDFEIKFDNYTSTETENHKEFVREIYLQMEKNGFITTKTEKRAFCSKCQKFLADAFIVGSCPKCDYEFAKGNQCEHCGTLLEAEELIRPKCKICEGTDIIFKETKHWYLDLKKLQPKIEGYVKFHPKWKGNVKHFTEAFLKEGLNPRAITRDIEWGIDAPFKGAKEKTIYCWGEAALGYVSATIEYFKTKDNSEGWKDFWFGKNIKQIYTIGKDNIVFHTILFPGQLIASGQGYHLPDQIAATEYLNWEGGKKFSKSRKIGIFMDDALKLLPATHWRFFLLYDRPETKDTNFSWKELAKASAQILVGSFGNFINRTLTFIQNKFEGRIPKAKLDKEDKEMLKLIEKTEKKVSRVLEEGQIKEAIEAWINLTNEGNAYFQKREPWKNEKTQAATLYTCAQLIKALAIFSYPFIPSVAEKIWKILNIKEKISWAELKKEIKSGHKINKPEIVVEKFEIYKIKKAYEELKR